MSARQLRFIIRGLDQMVGRTVRKIALDITSNLIEATPVNTGWARANWVPSVRLPFSGTAGDSDDFTAAEQQSGIANVLVSYSVDQGPIFVSNNVPYIGRLNDGSSAQAPSGFVQIAINKAVTQDFLSL